MSDRSVTLFEIHLGAVRVQLGTKTFGFGTKESQAEADATNETTHESAGTPISRCRGRQLAGVGAVGLGFLLLVAVAAIAWTRLHDTDLEAAAELDDLP